MAVQKQAGLSGEEALAIAIKKSKTYTDNAVASVRNKFQVAASYEDLPPVGDLNTIYLIPTGTDNVYEQYIYDADTSSYVDIGSTKIDLDEYATDEELDARVAPLEDLADNFSVEDGKLCYVVSEGNSDDGEFMTSYEDLNQLMTKNTGIGLSENGDLMTELSQAGNVSVFIKTGYSNNPYLARFYAQDGTSSISSDNIIITESISSIEIVNTSNVNIRVKFYSKNASDLWDGFVTDQALQDYLIPANSMATVEYVGVYLDGEFFDNLYRNKPLALDETFQELVAAVEQIADNVSTVVESTVSTQVAEQLPAVVEDQISPIIEEQVADQIDDVVAAKLPAEVTRQISTPVNQAVNTYCAANFSEWQGGLDSTLTDSSMAAPADKVGELKSALTSFCVCKNLIGNNVDEYYEVDLPNAIYYLNISTSDGSNFSGSGSGTMKLQLCDASKTVVHDISLASSLSYRDVLLNIGSAVKYLKLTKQSDVPLMVAKETAILGHAETYVPYYYSAKGLNQVIKDVKGEISTIESEISTIESGTAVIPSYYESHMASKEATILGISNADIQCVFVTDAHYDDNAKNSPILVKHLWQNVPLDFVISGGDCFKQEVNKADAMTKITKYNNQYAFCGENYFPIIGNHEHNNSDGQHSSVQLSLAQVNLATLSKVRNVMFSDKVSYRFDDAISKCRYYFIGCKYDSMLYDEDVHWFCNDLLSVPNGYSVVVFSHAGLKLTDGAVSGVQIKVNSICNALLAMANKTIYHNVIGADEYINYSNVNAIPIAVFSGHVHLDGHYQYSVGAYTGYIEVIATNCDAYGNQPVSEQDRTPDTVNEQSFDVISIDRTSRTIYMTRIGYGSDRTFTYYNYGA